MDRPMKCPKCGTIMGYDEAAHAWVCYLRSCAHELTAKDIPALAAENERLREALEEFAESANWRRTYEGRFVWWSWDHLTLPMVNPFKYAQGRLKGER